ncbi:oxygen-dependent coproporphyrinogen oxidase [Nonomuraea typhae]|uniref:coproporphyrinogen oxidase n=1 Tax=Nonomuraea typhae TaxID=2603600 RepID=A0ABW7YSK6_9ACTN
MIDEVHALLRAEQSRLVAVFEDYDQGGRFRPAQWERSTLGAGRACVLEGGRVFERAGVNVSLIHGERVPQTIVQTFPHTDGLPYAATGISMVLHPRNPYAPAMHANFRFFTVPGVDWWFGGGCDLTPMYGFADDAAHFHRTLRDWCDRHPGAGYEEWKAACDAYFTIPHRGEMRGVGGVFFDRISEEGPGGFGRCRALVADGLATIGPAYLPILDRRCRMPYGPRQRNWQLARRGRYVEFNLVYDRGTRFGLQTRGNIEAILMSMPPLARWGFELIPEPGSPESEVAEILQPRDWAGPRLPRGPVAGQESVETGRV